MTRGDAIKAGLIVQSGMDYTRNECLRKVPYTEFLLAFIEANRLAARNQKDGMRLNVYICRFCSRFHIGNYRPSQRTLPGQLAAARKENAELLGRVKMVENELNQCRISRQRLKSELGELRISKSPWQRVIAVFSKRVSVRTPRASRASSGVNQSTGDDNV